MYLGVDESNHGRNPEIYVGVVSWDPLCLIRQNLGKIRRKILDFSAIGSSYDFVHIVIPDRAREFYSSKFLQIFVLAEMIYHFQVEKRLSLCSVLVDGKFSPDSYSALEDLVRPFTSFPSLLGFVDGDRNFSHVNLADQLAYSLYHYYTGSEAGLDRYAQKRISFSLEKYFELL